MFRSSASSSPIVSSAVAHVLEELSLSLERENLHAAPRRLRQIDMIQARRRRDDDLQVPAGFENGRVDSIPQTYPQHIDVRKRL